MDTEYRNGEVRALIAPLFGMDAEHIEDVVIIVRTTDNIVHTYGLGDPDKPEHVTIENAMRLAHYGIRAMSNSYHEALTGEYDG
jgi:hypothetical protein